MNLSTGGVGPFCFLIAVSETVHQCPMCTDEGSEVADGLDLKTEEKVIEDEGLEQLSESPTLLLPKTLET